MTSEMNGLSGGGVIGNFTLVSNGDRWGSTTQTLNNLEAGKKYLLCRNGDSNDRTRLLNQLTINTITGGTYETLVEPYSYNGSPYDGYSAYVITAEQSTVTIVYKDYLASAGYMLFGIE